MFLADQGRDALIVKSIVLFQKFPAIGPPSSIGEVFLGPFYYYMVAPFLALFHLDPVGLAVGVALWCIAGLIASYFFVKNKVDIKTAIIFLLLSAFSYRLVDSARYSWNPNPLPYFAFATLFFFVLALEKPKKFLYPLIFGQLFGLSFQLHHLAALLALPIVVMFVLVLIKKRNMQLFFIPLASLSTFLFASVPLVIFDLRHNFLNTRNLVSVLTKQNIIAGGSWISRLLETNTAFLHFAFNVDFSSLQAALIMTALIIATVIKLQKKDNLFVLTNLAAVILFIIGFSHVGAERYLHYFGTVYLSLYLLIAYVIAPSKNKIAYGLSIALICAFIFQQATGYTFIFGAPSRQVAVPKTVGKFIADKANGTPMNMATYPTEFTSEDCFRYFIELNGGKVVERKYNEIASQMFVLCDKGECDILHTNSWNINMFGSAKIDTMWNVDDIRIFKLVHNN